MTARRSEGIAAATEDGEIVVATAALAGASTPGITPESWFTTTTSTGHQDVVVPLEGTA